MASVFLSYRHENAPHAGRVRELALKLRAAGLTVALDALANEEEFHMGGPDEGWPLWCYAQVEENDKVLIVITPSYSAIYEGNGQPGVGVGAGIEARRIFQQLYDGQGISPRFRVALLKAGDEIGLPDHLAGYHQFKLHERPADLAALITWLRAPVPEGPRRPVARHRPTGSGLPPFQPIPRASEYFGRGELVERLTARLRERQRTDVWGGAGMGKTALAAEAVRGVVGVDPASLAASPFPDGVVFLDLYQHHGDSPTAWQALANSFDATLPTEQPPEQRARAACAGRQALIILEGAEELAAALPGFIAVLAPENTLLVLTRDKSQTATARRVEAEAMLKDDDALALLRHLAGDDVPGEITAAVQARLGGHPLALTWAGSQLGEAGEPARGFLAEMQADPLAKLTEPAGDALHTLRWMFDRSLRRMAASTQAVLAAAARIAEPFAESLARTAGGEKADLQRLVSLGFLRVVHEPPGWQFAHALAARYARDLPLPEGLLETLGRWAIAALSAADEGYSRGEGHAPLDRALAHATALLGHDATGRTLETVTRSLIYHDSTYDTVGIRRGRLDFARRALEAVSRWQDAAPDALKETTGAQRERSVVIERLGNLAVAQGDLAGALRSFTERQTIAERLAASDPANAEWQRDLFVSLVKLGDLAVAQGDLAGALRSFTEGKTIAERLAASDPANAAWQRDLSVSLNKLGDLAVAQGDLAGALRYFKEDMAIAERLAASDPANAAWQRDLSVSLNKLGDLAVAQGDLAGALRSFTESKTIAERLAASDPANAAWQRDLSVSLDKLGDLAVAQGDLAGALRSFTESKTIRERLAASDPANAEWQRDLSVSLNKLGDLAVAQGDLAGALRSFTESKTIRERLAASDPANAAWQRDLSVSLEKMGNLAVAQGDLAGALRYFKEDMAIAERLAASDPANAAWQRDLSYSCYIIASKVFIPQERWADALQLMERSLQISERLAATDPSNVTWQNDAQSDRRVVTQIRERLGLPAK